MRRAIYDTLISGAVLLIIVMALASIDPRVRDHVRSFISAPTTPAAAIDAGNQLEEMASTLLLVARDQSIDHAPMMVFVVIATVLFLAMVRT